MSDPTIDPHDFLKRGWSVIPIKHRDAKGKQPAVKHEEYHTRLPTDEEVSAWEKMDLDGWGVLGGKVSGDLYLVDIDSINSGDTIAVRMLAEYVSKTFLVQSSPGKLHVYLHDSGAKRLGSTKFDIGVPADPMMPHIDLHGEGKYVLLPGSRHPKGHLYTVVADKPVADAPYDDVVFVLKTLYARWPLIRTLLPKFVTGNKHYMCLGLGAFGFHRGFSREETIVIAEALWYARQILSPDDQDLNGSPRVATPIKETWGKGERDVAVSWRKHWGEELVAQIEALPKFATTSDAKIAKLDHRPTTPTIPETEKAEIEPETETSAPRRAGPKMYRASELHETFKNTKLPWVAQDLLLKGEVTLFVGSAKIGKSTLILQLLWRVTTGNAWAFSKKELKVRHPAIYYSLEMGEVPLTRRMAQLFGRTFPDNLWVVPARDYTIDWDEIGEKVDATEASVVVIDNLLGTNIGDINKQEVVGKVMNDAFAFAQEKNVSVVIVHHTRKGPRIQEGQQQGDPLDEAHGSKVFANKAGILIFLRKTTGKGGKKYSYCEINIVSRFGESKTIKATFDKTQKGMWRRRSQTDSEDEGEDSELEGEEDEVTGQNDIVVPPPGTNHLSDDLTHRTQENDDVRSTGTNLASTNHSDLERIVGVEREARLARLAARRRR